MRFIVSTVVTLSALVLEPASAQDTTRTRADSGRRLDRMTITATRPPLTTAVGGVGVLVISPDSMRLTASPVLSDALREIPFVLVRQNSRGENEISIRGSDSRHQVVLYDGIPLTLGWDSRTDPSLIPMGGARSIAVARGLSTLLQGPNVIAGAVAVDLNRGDSDNTVETSAQVRTGVDQVGASALFGSVVRPWYSAGGKFTLRAGGGYSSRDGFPLSGKISDQYASNHERTNSDFEEIQAYLGLRYTTDAGQWLAASASGFKAERGVPPELHIAEPRLWRYPDTRRIIGVFSGGLGRKRTPFGSGDVEFVMAVNDGSQQIDNYTSATYSQVDATEYGDERTVTMRVEADHSLGRGEWRNAFTLATINYREQFDTDPASKYRQQLSSLATELDYPLWGLLRANVGAALESAETPLAGGRVTQPKLDAGAFRVGLSTVLSSGVRLHAAANRRSRFPALRELYSGALNRFEPSPNLEPERFAGLEAGATMFASGAQLQGVFFSNTLSDAILRITRPDGKFQRINRDRLKSSGIELLGNWSGETVTLGADFMFQHVRVSDPAASGAARRPENVPELGAGVNLDVRFGESLATMGLDYKGAQYCLHPDLGQNVKLRARTSTDASLAREFTVRRTGLLSRLRAVLAIDNAFDTAIFDQCGLPEPGRTIRLGMSLR